jgi:hypothetical protein
MDEDALSTYLNDHLAGAMVGCEQARQLEEMHADTPFRPEMSRVAAEIEEDRETLVALMEELDLGRSAVKQAGAWVAEKAGRVKFSGISAGDRELGRYLALEALSLGIEGKRSLWTALARLKATGDDLGSTDLERLIERAEAQREVIERQRIATALASFGDEAGSTDAGAPAARASSSGP